jgi:hypothetical protein
VGSETLPYTICHVFITDKVVKMKTLLTVYLFAFFCFSCKKVDFFKSRKASIDFLTKSNQKKYKEAISYFRLSDIAAFNNVNSRFYEGGINRNIDRSTHNGTISDINVYGGFVKNDTANILLKLKFKDGTIIDWNGKPNYFQMIKENHQWKALVTFPK